MLLPRFPATYVALPFMREVANRLVFNLLVVGGDFSGREFSGKHYCMKIN